MTNRNPKIVHIDFEEKMSLDDAIQFLETIVTKLKEERSFTLTHDGKTHLISPSSRIELEVKLEEQNNKQKLELELEWIDGEENKGLQIG